MSKLTQLSKHPVRLVQDWPGNQCFLLDGRIVLSDKWFGAGATIALVLVLEGVRTAASIVSMVAICNSSALVQVHACVLTFAASQMTARGDPNVFQSVKVCCHLQDISCPLGKLGHAADLPRSCGPKAQHAGKGARHPFGVRCCIVH